MFAAPINPCLSELQGGRPFDRSAAFAASLTPVEAPQLRCGLLSWCFARVSLRLCLKLHQRPSRPLESRQGRMALNPVAQALPAGVLWHQGFAFKQCLRFRSIVVDRNCKAAEPPSAPAPCRSGVRGRSAPAAGGNLRAYRPAHKPNRRFGRGARTVCCANAQKDRAPEGARIPLSTTLTARILTMFAAPINPCLSELQGGRPFDRSAAFAASLTPVEAPQLRCGLLSWSFARVSLRLCLKLHQRPSLPLESRQGRMALNPVASLPLTAGGIPLSRL